LQEFYDDPDRFALWLKQQWRIELDVVRRDFSIEGSPERTISRVVIQDRQQGLFLLEKLPKDRFALRDRVAKAVDYLNGRGLYQAVVYKKSKDDEFLPFFKGACYQLSRFHLSSGIHRPQYLNASKIGKNFAEFLICLDDAAKGIDSIIDFDPFSIKSYIYTLFRQMKDHDPKVYDAFCPILNFLENKFMDVHDCLPSGFCHGDLHPLNVIWNDQKVNAVIDWEFTGIKPDIYDAANLVGCAGIEDPAGLGQPMVMTFISRLKEKNLFSEKGWKYFPEYLIALRFAWLSEWLRKKDVPMIAMEEAYLSLLVKNIDILRQGWDL